MEKYLSRLSRLGFVALGLSMVVLVWVLDYLTGIEISFSIFYLTPIILVTWFQSRRLGILLSIFCAAGWFSADFFSGHQYSHFLIPVWNATVRLVFFLIIVIFLDKLKLAHQTERRLARLDQLTGLYNMVSFGKIAEREIERCKRMSSRFSILFIDLDNFKVLNDTCGHTLGSALLAEIGKTIGRHSRKTDISARFGGDEFVIFLPDTGLEAAREIAARLKGAIDEHIKSNDYPVTLSIGVSSFSGPPPSLNDLIKFSDQLMYEVKAEGKNNIKARSFN